MSIQLSYKWWKSRLRRLRVNGILILCPRQQQLNPLKPPEAISKLPAATILFFFFVGDHCLDDPLPEIITPSLTVCWFFLIVICGWLEIRIWLWSRPRSVDHLRKCSRLSILKEYRRICLTLKFTSPGKFEIIYITMTVNNYSGLR